MEKKAPQAKASTTPDDKKTDLRHDAVRLFDARPRPTRNTKRVLESAVEELLDSTVASQFGTAGQAPPEPLFGRALRFALAMRGGISLAVWIGGAVSELDLLRRIRWVDDGGQEVCYFLWPNAENPSTADEQVFARARSYAKLLRSRGYDHVEFDVLAGASAGGLNGVLYSVAQRVGARLDGVLRTWITSGAFWKLLRRPGITGVDSPLRADEFFAPSIMDAVLDLYTHESARQSHAAHHLVLDVSASVMDTQDSIERTARTGRAEFHFVGADHRPSAEDQSTLREESRMIPIALGADALSVVRGGPVPAYDPVGLGDPPSVDTVVLSLARLAYAARSTSSMPGGFEPGLIYSTYADPATNTGGLEGIPRLDMSFAFVAHRSDYEQPFRVIDGGLTDNMPIDRALLAIRNQASEVYTDRGILYLDPAPGAAPIIRTPQRYRGKSIDPILPTQPPYRGRTDRSSHLVTVVLRSLGLHANKESAEAKADQVEDYRRELLIGSGRMASLTPLSDSALAAYDTSFALQKYAEYRKATDAKLVADVLTNPDVWQLTTNLPTRYWFHPLVVADLAKLDESISGAYDAELNSASFDGPIWTGPQAIIDSCLSLLSWVRALEDAHFQAEATTRFTVARLGVPAPSPAGQPIADVRRRLYVELAKATDARDTLLLAICQTTLQMQPTLIQPSPDIDIAHAIARALVTNISSELADSPGILNSIASDLGRHVRTGQDVPTGTPWQRFPSSEGVTAIQVAAFAAAAGIPSPVSLKGYAELSAEVDTAGYHDFVELKAKDFRLTLKSILALPRSSDITMEEVRRLFTPTRLSASAKLTGSGLREFAGFLSGDWRRNDWLWGRMDGAAGILNFIEGLKAEIPGEANAIVPETIRENVQTAILKEAAIKQLTDAVELRSDLAPFDDKANLVPADDPSGLRQRMALGADGLSNLRAGYRVGLASKAVHAGFRALGRPTSSPIAPLLVLLFQPFGNWIPAILDLPRFLLLLGVLGTTWTVGTTPILPVPHTDLLWPWQQPWHWHWYWLGMVVVIAFLVVSLTRLIFSVGRWNKIITKLECADAPPPEQTTALKTVRKLRNGTLRTSVALFIVGSLLTLVCLFAMATHYISVEQWIFGILVGVVVVTFSIIRLRSVSARDGHPIWNFVIGLIAVAVVAFAIAAPPQWLASLLAFRDLHLWGWASPHVTYVALLPAVIGFAAAVIALVCNYGWRAGVFPDREWLSKRLNVAALLGAVALLPIWAAVVGVAGFYGTYLLEILTHSHQSYFVQFCCAAFGLFVAGTVQWYLTQLPPHYFPSDAAGRRNRYRAPSTTTVAEEAVAPE